MHFFDAIIDFQDIFFASHVLRSEQIVDIEVDEIDSFTNFVFHGIPEFDEFSEEVDELFDGKELDKLGDVAAIFDGFDFVGVDFGSVGLPGDYLDDIVVEIGECLLLLLHLGLVELGALFQFSCQDENHLLLAGV